jgi:hypothetical protein
METYMLNYISVLWTTFCQIDSMPYDMKCRHLMFCCYLWIGTSSSYITAVSWTSRHKIKGQVCLLTVCLGWDIAAAQKIPAASLVSEQQIGFTAIVDLSMQVGKWRPPNHACACTRRCDWRGKCSYIWIC